MLFRHLSQRAPGSLVQVVEGTLISVVVHVVAIGLFFMPKAAPNPLRELPESFEWARFLLPVDRPQGNPAVPGERITYMATPAAPGGAGTEQTDEPRTERVQLQVPEGTQEDPLAGQATPPEPEREVKGEEVMTVLEVDSAATRVEDGAAPPYPPAMLARKLEGSVAVQYIVDTTGRADTSSFQVLDATHKDFAESVRRTLPLMRFRAAKMNDTKVRQLVQQLFSFRIDTAMLAAPKKP
jgi:Gram-negative bacterial TonB protein C-terminal